MVDLIGDDGEIGRIILHEVPGIGCEPMPDLVDETGRAKKMEFFLPAQEEPYQVVETDEMVDMGMGDEDVTEPQQFPGRQMGNLPDVEEYGPSLEKEIDV